MVNLSFRELSFLRLTKTVSHVGPKDILTELNANFSRIIGGIFLRRASSDDPHRPIVGIEESEIDRDAAGEVAVSSVGIPRCGIQSECSDLIHKFFLLLKFEDEGRVIISVVCQLLLPNHHEIGQLRVQVHHRIAAFMLHNCEGPGEGPVSPGEGPGVVIYC